LLGKVDDFGGWFPILIITLIVPQDPSHSFHFDCLGMLMLYAAFTQLERPSSGV
jgi:hypothetical protein